MLYGLFGNRTFTSNSIHQAARALDLGTGVFISSSVSNNGSKDIKASFSAGTQWTNAVNNDSCVVDKV